MWDETLGAAAILLAIFSGVWGIIFISGRNKIAILREKRMLAEAQTLAAQPAPAALPVPADPNAAPVLALKLPEPQRSEVMALLCQLQDVPDTLDGRSRYLLQQAQAEYLPETLRAYLALSEGAKKQLHAQGMNAETLLSEQLNLIQEGVQDALRHDHAAADRVLTQGRFLRERFQVKSTELLVKEK